MAMIKCRECGKEISSRAEVCPHCGAKTRYGSEMESKKGMKGTFYLALALMVIGVLLMMNGMPDAIDAMNWGYIDSGAINKVTWGIGLLGGGGVMLALTWKNSK